MQKNELGAGLVLINKKTLLSKIPVSDRTIDAMEKEGAFPKRIALNSRNVVWVLDEVDAPLDDANTSRFCRLVEQMSQHTQFLYISHNRLTMEMAEQLIGVTMQEKGVSRIVEVDIKQALELAAQ